MIAQTDNSAKADSPSRKSPLLPEGSLLPQVPAPEPSRHFFREDGELSSPAPFPLRSRAITFSARRANCRALHLFLSGAGPSLFPRGGRTAAPLTFSAPAPSLHPFLISRQPTPPVTLSSPSLPDPAAHPFSGPFQGPHTPPFHPSRAHPVFSPYTPRNPPPFSARR